MGSGSHQHFSLAKAETPLFSDGTGARAMTAEGESAVAGLLAGLPDAQGILCGSILSGLRMQPGHWAGAYVCWGTENREAAVRFLSGGPSNPHGANVEVKVMDTSANPYFASAAILGLALDGIERKLSLPPETTVDPAALTDEQRDDAGIVLLPTSQADALAALDQSALLRGILGDAARSTPWSRCAATSRRITASSPRTSLPKLAACPGACDRASRGQERSDPGIVSSASALIEHIENVPPPDHHVHGYWLQAPDRPGDSRTDSTKPTSSRWQTSTRRSTHSWGSRCARIARGCWG